MKARQFPAVLTAAAMLFASLPQPAEAEVQSYDREAHTAKEISAFFASHPWDMQNVPVFDAQPSLTAPYSPGALSAATQQELQNCLNCIRYTAGLPADLTVKPEYSELAQAASLVNRLNGELDHTPVKPNGMSEPLYRLGSLGSGGSALSSGRPAFCQSIVEGLMGDSNDKNMPMIGHRRWLLNPELLYTGFGQTEKYYAVYVSDYNRQEKFTGDYIAWPPPNMPYYLYGKSGRYAMTVSLGDAYDTADISKVSAEIRSEVLDKTWHLDGSCTDFDYYLTVNNQLFGTGNSLIIYPGELFPENDSVTVSISGITKKGEPAPITYSIQFFDMDPRQRGDINLDGEVSVEDAQDTLKAYTETVAGKADGLSDAQRRTADVNADSTVSVEDAQYILKYYVSNTVAGRKVTWDALLAEK